MNILILDVPPANFETKYEIVFLNMELIVKQVSHIVRLLY